MELDRDGLEVLGREECLALLRTASVARLGLSMHALPVVLPVAFGVDDDDRLIVRTSRSTKLDAALAGAVVAFEADDFDERTGDAWSVLVRGSSVLLAEPTEPPAVVDRALWVSGTSDQWVAISTDLVSGRRFRRQASAQPQPGADGQAQLTVSASSSSSDPARAAR